ncbi:hypothetical protein LguiA_003823 [Lonicera macranthoides]
MSRTLNLKVRVEVTLAGKGSILSTKDNQLLETELKVLNKHLVKTIKEVSPTKRIGLPALVGWVPINDFFLASHKRT